MIDILILAILLLLFYLAIKMVSGSDNTAKQCIESVKRFQRLRHLKSADMIVEKRLWEDFTDSIELNNENAKSETSSRVYF